MTRARLLVIGFFLVSTSAAAQPPAPAPAGATPSAAMPGAAPAAVAKPETAAPTPPPNYAYAPDGRRDPFVRTIGRGVILPAQPANVRRPQGVPGLLVAEIVVRGFLESQGAWIAMVGAPDGRTYTVRTGDHLMDGTIRAITPEAIVILQDVRDPMSVAKQREVRKFLRGGEQVQ